MHKSKLEKTLFANLILLFHFLKELFVILPFINKSGIFFCFILCKKLGHISDSTKKAILGFQCNKNFSIKLGTWYPEGGMHKIVEAMVDLAEEKGVKFYTNEEVKKVSYFKRKISHVITTKKTYDADYVVCSGDYHHFDQSIWQEILP